MSVAPVFVDAERVVYDWLNAQTDVVDTGNPIPKGAQLKRLRSPAYGAYALLTTLPGDDDYMAGGASRARVSAALYGATKAEAEAAARAYANALRRLYAGNTRVGDVVIYVVDNITGPFYVKDGDEERYIVDADFFLGPIV